MMFVVTLQAHVRKASRPDWYNAEPVPKTIDVFVEASSPEQAAQIVAGSLDIADKEWSKHIASGKSAE